ncbi:hypothetical protein Acsp06_42620 [Actinomycetospora sp. NBRC 106375]|uniref:hypothetical protein n=1 Tax=Actinomycetospora sp. NBRC 106375 TaxID=3032207 RepID=UPI0024A08381|nr:hypothetical protein [Actinomycetospora sp. NBRC 106375]GLZ48077.1 hypothetical protein Acsp06_42620 [Actinomycetospora sp. NBRC 106375]
MAKAKIKVKINEKALQRAVHDAVDQRRADLQRALDRAHRSTAGASVDEVKAKLSRELKAATGERPDSKIVDGWARVIASGTRVKLEIKD